MVNYDPEMKGCVKKKPSLIVYSTLYLSSCKFSYFNVCDNVLCIKIQRVLNLRPNQCRLKKCDHVNALSKQNTIESEF